MTRLRLAPRPLARCTPPAPEARPYPPTEGLCLRRGSVSGLWIIERTIRGRTESISVTRDQLAQLVLEGTQFLKTETGR